VLLVPVLPVGVQRAAARGRGLGCPQQLLFPLYELPRVFAHNHSKSGGPGGGSLLAGLAGLRPQVSPNTLFTPLAPPAAAREKEKNWQGTPLHPGKGLAALCNPPS